MKAPLTPKGRGLLPKRTRLSIRAPLLFSCAQKEGKWKGCYAEHPRPLPQHLPPPHQSLGGGPGKGLKAGTGQKGLLGVTLGWEPSQEDSRGDPAVPSSTLYRRVPTPN
jgi:hypothetical protein